MSVLPVRFLLVGFLLVGSAAVFSEARAQVPIVVDQKMAEHNAEQTSITTLERWIERRVLRLLVRLSEKAPASGGRDVSSLLERPVGTGGINPDAGPVGAFEIPMGEKPIGEKPMVGGSAGEPPPAALLATYRVELQRIQAQIQGAEATLERLRRDRWRLLAASRQGALDRWAGARLHAAEDRLLLQELLRSRSLLRTALTAEEAARQRERVSVLIEGLTGRPP